MTDECFYVKTALLRLFSLMSSSVPMTNNPTVILYTALWYIKQYKIILNSELNLTATITNWSHVTDIF